MVYGLHNQHCCLLLCQAPVSCDITHADHFAQWPTEDKWLLLAWMSGVAGEFKVILVLLLMAMHAGVDGGL